MSKTAASTLHHTTNHPAHQRHAAFTPTCFLFPWTHANAFHHEPICMAQRHHGCNFAAPRVTDETQPCDAAPPIIRHSAEATGPRSCFSHYTCTAKVPMRQIPVFDRRVHIETDECFCHRLPLSMVSVGSDAISHPQKVAFREHRPGHPTALRED